MKVGSSQLCSQLEQEYIRRKGTIPMNAQPRAKDAAYQADAGPSCHGKKNPRGGERSNATSAGRTESKKELRCWNCEGIGHWKTECPSPAHEKSGRGDGTSKATEAANALDDHEVAGSWMVVVPDNSKEDGGDELTVDVNMATVASILATEDSGSVDLYGSGMTRHISPNRERFISLESIKPKGIIGAGRGKFYVIAQGDIIINVPNGQQTSKMWLTNILYAPEAALMLISIGRIDDAGYHTAFWKGHCEISARPEGKGVIGRIPKRNGLYSVTRVLKAEQSYMSVESIMLE
jgi:hypothetical protein